MAKRSRCFSQTAQNLLMNSNDFGKCWITQLRLTHASAVGEIAQSLLVSFPAFLDRLAQIFAKNWPYFERSELQSQELSFLPAPPLDFLFGNGHDVAVADLAKLLRNHESFIP